MLETLKQLDGPPVPESLHYLRDWLDQVHGRSGVTDVGLAPLTYDTIGEWSRLKRIPIEPHEIDALILLDSILLYAAKQKEPPVTPASPSPSRPSPRGRR